MRSTNLHFTYSYVLKLAKLEWKWRKLHFAIGKALASDDDSDDERAFCGVVVVVRRVQHTTIVSGVGRSHILDHQNSALVDFQPSGQRRCRRHRRVIPRGLDEASAPRPDDQPVRRVVGGRTRDPARQTAGEVAAAQRASGGQASGVCSQRHGGPPAARRHRVVHSHYKQSRQHRT